MKSIVRMTILAQILATIPIYSSYCQINNVHVIVGTQQGAWAYRLKMSSARQPLVVDDLQAGDTLDISIPAGSGAHGFMIIKTLADGSSVEARDMMLTCGESASSKPNAVLQEIWCGSSSLFGTTFSGNMYLKVMSNFNADLYFWCVTHHADMSGILKLKK